MPLDGQQMRVALIEKTRDLLRTYPESLNHDQVLREVARDLGIRGASGRDAQAGLLTIWYDLFREGYLSWGIDIDNPNPPFCHLTGRGRTFLSHISHDPANHQGYMQYLTSQTTLNPVAQSYIQEALNTYNNMCYKATAVMVGAAAESMVIEVRDTLVGHMKTTGQLWTTVAPAIQKRLEAWQISLMLAGIEEALDAYKKKMPQELRESFTAFWPAFTGQIRMARNEAGHPTSVNPVAPETAHGVLLTFPHQARLAYALIAWIPSGIT